MMMMMDPRVFLLIGLALAFLANLDLVEANNSDYISCFKCLPDVNKKCKARDAKIEALITCGPRSEDKDTYCYEYYDNKDSTDGAKRSCGQSPKGTNPLDGCNDKLECFCSEDACNDKDSYKDAMDRKPGGSTVDPRDEKSAAPPPPPTPDTSKGPTIGFNFITTLAMITIYIFLY